MKYFLYKFSFRWSFNPLVNLMWNRYDFIWNSRKVHTECKRTSYKINMNMWLHTNYIQSSYEVTRFFCNEMRIKYKLTSYKLYMNMCLTFHTDFIWSYMKFIWISQEFYMKSMWNTNQFHTKFKTHMNLCSVFYTNFIWNSHEVHMNFTRTLYAVHMKYKLTAYEIHMDINLIFYTDFFWSSRGVLVNSTHISYEVHMKYKRSYYDIHVNMCLIFHLIGSSYVVHMNFTWITQSIRMNLRCTIWEYARVLV